MLFATGTNPLRSRLPAVVAVSPLLREVLLALTTPEPPTARKATHLRNVVLDELTPTPQPPLQLPEPRDDRLRAVAYLLHDNPADRRPLAELGRAVGASARTLSRLLRTELGMSFPQWRERLRLLHTVGDLVTDQPVATIAHRYGYSSPSAFIAAFRRAFGTTPGAYQADWPSTSEYHASGLHRQAAVDLPA
ncbi:MAG: helix-turn-helix transcriptional regulator [Kutzneria sp.]|nr:helix-turn-helix transcriptional regulator [Kutzneria sp.]